jgi:predicted lactoylglutathione lyase
MSTQIFVNLPIKNLPSSVAFFTTLGYTFNPQLTDENSTCMIVSDNIFVMLLVEPFFRTFTRKTICDARKSCEVIISLPADSREKVGEFIGKAVAAGATTPTEAKDYGFMYLHGFDDLDGHRWELFHMLPAALGQPE